jgi:hypothetical protein
MSATPTARRGSDTMGPKRLLIGSSQIDNVLLSSPGCRVGRPIGTPRSVSDAEAAGLVVTADADVAGTNSGPGAPGTWPVTK